MKGLLGKIASEFNPRHDFDIIPRLDIKDIKKLSPYASLNLLFDYLYLSFKHSLRGLAVGGCAGAIAAYIGGKRIEDGIRTGALAGMILDVAQVSFRGALLPTYNYLFRKKKSNNDN